MAQQTPTETLKFTDARQNLSQLVNRVARREMRVLIEKSGVPAVAIVPADDLQRLDAMEARREEQFEAMREFSRAFADVPIEELEEQVARALAEARAELRAEREAAVQR
ncbi:MAG: type II toxin-antitoxin system Phd/YefM family antitoxin [Thermomicrobiales bacterium]